MGCCEANLDADGHVAGDGLEGRVTGVLVQPSDFVRVVAQASHGIDVTDAVVVDVQLDRTDRAQ